MVSLREQSCYLRFGKIINTTIMIWWRCEIQSPFFSSLFSQLKNRRVIENPDAN